MRRILVVDPWEDVHEAYQPESRFYFAQAWGIPTYHEYGEGIPRWRHLSTIRRGVGSLEAAQELAGKDAPVYHLDMKPPQAGMFKGGKGLIIGNGNSAGRALKLAGSYDVKFCANAGYPAFTQLAYEQHDWFWFAPEVDSFHFRWFYNVPVHFKKILNPQKRLFPLEIYDPMAETYFVDRGWNDPLDVRDYGIGLQDHHPCMIGSGTYLLNSLHLMSIMGCDKIGVVGCELDWQDGKEGAHFYEDKSVSPPQWRKNFDNAARIVGGQLKHFREQGVEIEFITPSKAQEFDK